MDKNIRFGLMATKVVLDTEVKFMDTCESLTLYDPNALKVDSQDFERNLAL